MDNTPALVAVAAVLGGAYLVLQQMQQQAGSGAGDISTDTPGEGSILDLAGLANQITDAVNPSPQGNPTTISAAGIEALKAREGFSASAYADHKGYSIGYGHLIKPGESLSYVSVQQATDLLLSDIDWAKKQVCTSITAPINQAQFDALTSFCYNVGAGAFARSTLVKRINAQDPSAADEFARWVFASGTVNTALVNRRNSERQQFESGTA